MPAPLINLRILSDEENIAEIIQQNYTCPIDGYEYAWQADRLPNYLWYLSACPIDTTVANLKAQITIWVTQGYNGSTQMLNPFSRIKQILKYAHDKAATWVSDTANVDAAYSDYLSSDKLLITFIIDELKKQGIVT